MLKIDMEYFKKILFVRLKGNLNYKTCYKINNFLVPMIKKHHIKYLVYNADDLYNVDNAGINSLINTKYSIKNNKGLVWACSNNKNIKNIFINLKIPNIKKENDAFKKVEVIK